VIRGRVQGVGFRFFVMRNARALGVSGTVRNRADGAVEAVFQADAADPVEEMVERVRQGPPSARVGGVEVEDLEEKPYGGFEIVR